jgi:hypothetical protein
VKAPSGTRVLARRPALARAPRTAPRKARSLEKVFARPLLCLWPLQQLHRAVLWAGLEARARPSKRALAMMQEASGRAVATLEIHRPRKAPERGPVARMDAPGPRSRDGFGFARNHKGRLEGPFEWTVSRGLRDGAISSHRRMRRLEWPSRGAVSKGRRNGALSRGRPKAPFRVSVSIGRLEGPSRGALYRGPLEGPARGAFSKGPLEGPARGAFSKGLLTEEPFRGPVSRGRRERPARRGLRNGTV